MYNINAYAGMQEVDCIHSSDLNGLKEYAARFDHTSFPSGFSQFHKKLKIANFDSWQIMVNR